MGGLPVPVRASGLRPGRFRAAGDEEFGEESASPTAADAGQHGGRRSAKARQTARGGAFGSPSRLISVLFFDQYFVVIAFP